MDFARVEAEFRRLKAQFEKGSLAEADFKAQLEELMIEDEQGRWWVIGYKTGEWYVHDGEKWVQQKPPRAGRGQRPRAPDLPSDPQHTRLITTRPRMQWKLEKQTLPVVLIAAGWLVCLGLWIIAGTSTYYLPWTSMAVLGSTGVLITGLVLRRTDPPAPWRQIPVVTLGWAVGMAIVWALWAPYSTPRWALNAVIVGLTGALIVAGAIKWTHPSIQWKHVGLVTLGWVIGCAIGGVTGWVIFWLRTHDASYIALVYALWIGTSGTAGSWLAFWLVRDKLPGSP